ncbi:histidine phosphatase family protein [Minwuia sp.]|uniref:histidine phosphatase family protein n=1 Tax=Minwuia sp. TaxID=2493630 RepID=UPI003A8ED762
MSTATTFIWVRHAPTGIADRMIGRTDVPAILPEPEMLGPLWDALSEVDRVICSPLIRARQTAAALFPEMRPERRAGLVEQDFGDWEDRAHDDCPFPDDLDAQALAAFRPPGGESFADVCARTADEIDDLCREHAGQILGIVAHAGVIRAALVHALGAPPASGIAFDVAHLSMTRVTLFDGGARVDHVNRIASPPPPRL